MIVTLMMIVNYTFLRPFYSYKYTLLFSYIRIFYVITQILTLSSAKIMKYYDNKNVINK
jgi:hypothetical protein